MWPTCKDSVFFPSQRNDLFGVVHPFGQRFLTKQCHPRFKNDRASAWWAGVGAAITTAFVSGGNSSADRNAGTLWSFPNARAFSRFKSAIPPRRACPNPAKIRAWCRPIWPTPTTPIEIRSDSGKGPLPPTVFSKKTHSFTPITTRPIARAPLRNSSLSKNKCFPRFHRQTPARPTEGIPTVLSPPPAHRTEVLPGFGHFRHRKTWCKGPRPSDTGVGPFNGFDRQNRLVFHAHGLTQIQTGNGFGRPKPNSCPAFGPEFGRSGVRGPSGAKSVGQVRHRRLESDALFPERIRHRAQQRIGFFVGKCGHHLIAKVSRWRRSKMDSRA
jgi:hypothetical protein